MINQPSGKLKIVGAKKVGEKGYFKMSDSWMNDYVYEVIVNKKIFKFS
nr:C1 family peptidase [Apilactobacillus ozensis]